MLLNFHATVLQPDLSCNCRTIAEMGCQNFRPEFEVELHHNPSCYRIVCKTSYVCDPVIKGGLHEHRLNHHLTNYHLSFLSIRTSLKN